MSKYSEKQKALANGEIGIDYSNVVEQSQIEKTQTNRELDVEFKKKSIVNLDDRLKNLDLNIEIWIKSIEVLDQKIAEYKRIVNKWELKKMNYQRMVNEANLAKQKMIFCAKETKRQLEKMV